MNEQKELKDRIYESSAQIPAYPTKSIWQELVLLTTAPKYVCSGSGPRAPAASRFSLAGILDDILQFAKCITRNYAKRMR
jgi:hypothetical protein